MKAFFICLLAIMATSAKAQNTDSLIIRTEDKFTGDVTYNNRNPITIYSANKDKCSIIMVKRKHNSTLGFLIYSPDFGCIEQYSYIYFITEDGTKLTTQNVLKFNCDGQTAINFDSWMDRKEKKFLHEYTIKSIRVEGSKTSFDFDLDPTIARQIKQIVLSFDKQKL